MASIGESDGDSYYVKLTKNSPTSLANTPYLEGYIIELEEMHEVLEGELVKIAQSMVIFSHIGKLKIPELDDAKTNPLENYQDNGAMTLVNTQRYPPHLPLE